MNQATLDAIDSYAQKQDALNTTASSATASFESYSLSSHFQPIFSLSMGRRVGHEALLRPALNGQPVSPLAFLQSERSFAELQKLDQLCHVLHMQNFRQKKTDDSWLFLNMHPEVFLRAPHAEGDASFAYLLDGLGFPSNLLVVEVLEEAVRENTAFACAVNYFRELGCLIALDDFGAGHSNFDRVWKIQPEIVKLDRSLIKQAREETKIRRILPQMVSLLHEAGALVLMEGVETLEEAHIALDADIDFVQGFYFGRPAAELADVWQSRVLINGTWVVSDQLWQDERIEQHMELAAYQNAIGYAASLLSSGRSLNEACADFLNLPLSQFCYLLDGSGRQIGSNLWAQHANPSANPRLEPLKDTRNARWSRRPYFRSAMEHFGRVQTTRPYLSISSSCLCSTISSSFKIEQDAFVLCGDVKLE